MAAPTLVQTVGNVTVDLTTPKTASLTVQAGDLIVVKVASGGPKTTLNAPTGGGLTFQLQQSIVGVTNQANAYVWTSQSPSSQTFTLSIALPAGGGGAAWSFEAKVWRNHNGVGTSAKRYGTATAGLSVTTTAPDSVIEVLNADWAGVNGSTRTWLTGAGALTETSYQRNANWDAFYGGHHADVTAVGTYTVGLSAPSGQHPSTIALEVLAAPVVVTGSLSITASALPSNAPPAVQVNINDTRSPGQASQLTIMRINPDGTQSPVRTSDGNPLPLSSGVGVVYDYEAPYGQPVAYTSAEVPGVTSPQVTVTSSSDWLVDPAVPDLSVPVQFRPGTLQKVTYQVRQGVFQPMGRQYPVVVTDGARKAGVSTLVVSAESSDDIAGLLALLSNASVLLLNPSDSSWRFDPCYIAVGDVDVTRWTDVVIDDNRDFTLPITIVDRPAGGSQAQRTYADLLASYGTYAAADAAYGSYIEMLAGP